MYLWFSWVKQALLETYCTEYNVRVKDVLTKFTVKLKPISSNITKEERKALHNLKKDDSCMVLTIDKGVTLVITDKTMYIEKYIALLNDEELYCKYRDQIMSIYYEVVKQLLDLKNSIGPKFNDQYIKLHPPGYTGSPARFCALSKIHKVNITFRPIVSACGTST